MRSKSFSLCNSAWGLAGALGQGVIFVQEHLTVPFSRQHGFGFFAGGMNTSVIKPPFPYFDIPRYRKNDPICNRAAGTKRSGTERAYPLWTRPNKKKTRKKKKPCIPRAFNGAGNRT